MFIKNINDEVSYSVLASALTGLNRMNKEKAGPLVAKYEKEESSVMTNAISAIYMANGDPKALTLIEGKLDDVEGFEAFGLFGTYTELLLSSDKATLVSGFEKLQILAQNESISQWKKFAISKAIFDIASSSKENKEFSESESKEMVSKSNAVVENFKKNETNEQLQNAFNNMIIKQ